LHDGARAIEDALADAFAKGAVRPREFGGKSSTADILQAVVQRL
jgi:isocitrate/isopropylmalate dehydrogenase